MKVALEVDTKMTRQLDIKMTRELADLSRRQEGGRGCPGSSSVSSEPDAGLHQPQTACPHYDCLFPNVPPSTSSSSQRWRLEDRRLAALSQRPSADAYVSGFAEAATWPNESCGEREAIAQRLRGL